MANHRQTFSYCGHLPMVYRGSWNVLAGDLGVGVGRLNAEDNLHLHRKSTKQVILPGLE